jgi:hypothetical protein
MEEKPLPLLAMEVMSLLVLRVTGNAADDFKQ